MAFWYALSRDAELSQSLDGVAALPGDEPSVGEDVVLDLGMQRPRPWFESLTRDLSAGDDCLGLNEVMRLIVRLLLDREDPTRMLGLLSVALERNVQAMLAMDFMTRLRETTDVVCLALERRCPALEAGGGIRFLLRLHILIAEALRMAHVSGMFAAAIREVAPGISDAARREEIEHLTVVVLADLTRSWLTVPVLPEVRRDLSESVDIANSGRPTSWPVPTAGSMKAD